MLDFIVLFIVILFVLIGILRGFIKEIFGLIGIVVAVIVTVCNHDALIQIFKIEKNLVIFEVISTICVFIISFLIVILIQSWIIHALSPIRLRFFDRFLGCFAGAFKGCMISYLLLVMLNMYYYSLYYDQHKKYDREDYYLPDWMRDSVSYSVFLPMDVFVNTLIPEDVHQKIESFGDNFSTKAAEEPDKQKRK